MLCYDRDTVPVESALCRRDIRSSTARQSANKSAIAWRPLGLRINGVCIGARDRVSTAPCNNLPVDEMHLRLAIRGDPGVMSLVWNIDARNRGKIVSKPQLG